jgi:anti-anti-sigma regulatory factor
MNVKIDTKEKFRVLTPEENVLSVNMTDELKNLLLSCLNADVKNVILNLKEVQTADNEIAEQILTIQQQFYEAGYSFVICELNPALEQQLDEAEMLELMNVTPTESEAWDIVQMEEIERELLGDE